MLRLGSETGIFFVKSGTLVVPSTQRGYYVSQFAGLVGINGFFFKTATVPKEGTASESSYGLALSLR